MKRMAITLEAIAAFDNLTLAAAKAARGKRTRPDVRAFFAEFDCNITALGEDIGNGRAPRGEFKHFTIHDPKRRQIHAACFQDRVLHHAIMNLAAPVLERSMIANTFACLPGRGVHEAVDRAQRYIRRFPWFVKIDVRHYFDCIDHDILLELLGRRFKGRPFLALLERIVRGYATTPGKGLPIGSLTSQYFANLYLDGFDRFMQQHALGLAYVRYMDDMIVWCDSRHDAHALLGEMGAWLGRHRELQLKEDVQINRSARGVAFCGFRIAPGVIRLGQRRRQRYAARRKGWEHEYAAGRIDAVSLQRAYAAVHAITHGADAAGWRRQNLALHPPADV